MFDVKVALTYTRSRPAALLKKSLWHMPFPANFGSFKNTFFYRTPPVAASSFSRLTVMLFNLLWRGITKPTFLHVRKCLMLKLLSQTHVLGVRNNDHPYLMLTRFQNARLLSVNTLSLIGRVVSHVETPGSVLMVFNLHCYPVSLDLNWLIVFFFWLYSCSVNVKRAMTQYFRYSQKKFLRYSCKQYSQQHFSKF